MGEGEPEIRIGDDERNAVVDRLSHAMAEGRLDVSEFEARSRQAYAAKVPSELEPLVADLPGVDTHPVPTGSTPARNAPANGAQIAAPVPTHSGSRRWFVSLFGDTKRLGRWDPKEQTVALTLFGDVVLELTDVDRPAVDIVTVSIFGDLKVIVGDEAEVDATSFSVFGDFRDEVGAPSIGGGPQVRVRHFALFGDLKLKRA